MGVITWKPRFETGHVRMDEQHRALAEALNGLHGAMERETDRPEQMAALQALKEGTAEHFREEEDLMDRFGFPGALEHKGIHGRLLAQMEELSRRLEDGRTELRAPVLDFLEGWLLDHVQGEDVELAQFLRSRGNGVC